LICRREHIAGAVAPRRRRINTKTICRRWRQIALLRYQGKNPVIRTDTDEINQPQIARDNQQLKTASIARKARVSTAINTVLPRQGQEPQAGAIPLLRMRFALQ